ncbi:TRAP transporter small permease [Alteribacillus sp. HJP-4]|uniref:TRAP transporter small permease n=1 Tax=Alteribacillus sp. HJP-4 TaxID=2775394 RepID=UPI0035CCD074
MTSNSIFINLKNGYLKIESFVVISLFISLVALVFMEVVVRAFDSPTRWSVGVAQLIFMWLIFIGANQALRGNSHIGIDIVTQLLPKQFQRYLAFGVNALLVLFLAMLVYYGLEMTFANTGRIISGTSIGYFYTTLAVPVGAFLMLITGVFQMINLIKASSKT